MSGFGDFITALNPGTLLLSLGGKIIDNLIPDPAQQAAAKLKLLEMQQQGQFKEIDTVVALAKQQTDVNKVEAASPSLFIGGWRPGVGWVCVFGLGYSFIGFPMLSWASTYYKIPPPPVADMGTLITMLGGMLGLGGLRTAEKIKGVAAP